MKKITLFILLMPLLCHAQDLVRLKYSERWLSIAIDSCAGSFIAFKVDSVIRRMPVSSIDSIYSQNQWPCLKKKYRLSLPDTTPLPIPPTKKAKTMPVPEKNYNDVDLLGIGFTLELSGILLGGVGFALIQSNPNLSKALMISGASAYLISFPLKIKASKKIHKKVLL